MNRDKLPKVSERYRLLKMIGEGGLGQVWSGEQSATVRPVAIKIYSGLERLVSETSRDASIQALERGLRRQAQLQSPFVLDVLDMSMNAKPAYAVFELSNGGSLRQCLQSGALETKFALTVFSQILHGLQSAHTIGLIHEDLKPENILFDDSGNVRMSDFGLNSAIESSQSIHFGRYVDFGSLGYMAPELMRRNPRWTHATDVYALGILLYEMLVGRCPGRRAPLPSEVVDGLPTVLDELFVSMTHDDHEQRLVDLDSILEKLSDAKGLPIDVNQSSAHVFTQPPVPLPGLSSTPLPSTAVLEDVSESLESSAGQPDWPSPAGQMRAEQDASPVESTRLLDIPEGVEKSQYAAQTGPENVPTAVPIKVTRRPRSASGLNRRVQVEGSSRESSDRKDVSQGIEETENRSVKTDADEVNTQTTGPSRGTAGEEAVTRPAQGSIPSPVAADTSMHDFEGRRDSINTVVTKVDGKP
ncbi:MAG: serine/threonine-protein kinase [Myxococcota bacterium]|nr:serine/threonine-protein kinase [Myxococcota bacterium]